VYLVKGGIGIVLLFFSKHSSFFLTFIGFLILCFTLYTLMHKYLDFMNDIGKGDTVAIGIN